MRRNMGRRSNNNSGGPGGGPLMTAHLHDIDLELELLKRKREMIQQQHKILAMEQQYKNSSRHSFDQMRYDEPSSNRDFTHMYGTGSKHRSQFGRKRQAENQWQYDSAPKRTPPKKKPQFNQNGSGNSGSGNRNPRPNQGQAQKPAPLMEIKVPKQSIGQRIANQKAPPKAPQKNFTPSKVSKPKAPAAPNKLASHSVTERKSLVAAAMGKSSDDMSRMLLPDRVPSQQVSGRLELALGAIMKNIKGLIEAKTEHAPLLRSLQLQRVMKQAVRERIRTVMLGKVVGSLIEILAIYREEFPEETDADIMNIALEASGVSAPDVPAKPKFIESAEPTEFYRANMSKLIENTLIEMYSKLEDIYGIGASNDAKPNDATPSGAKPNDAPPSDATSSDVPPTDATASAATPSDATPSDATPSDATPKEATPTEATPTEATPTEATPTDATPNDTTPNDAPPSDAPATQVTVDLQKTAEDKAKDEQDEYKAFLNTTIKVFDVKRVVPRLMKKYIPYVIKLLNVDAMYQNTKAAITLKTNEKAARIASKAKTEEGQGDANTSTPAVMQTSGGGGESRYNLPYYVKIMGKPSLPKRKVMQAFLSKYNPKSIKKHRTIHNLLFVGFTEQADYDVMVAADGTVIGKSTLSIRICTKGGSRESNGEAGGSLDVSQVSVKQESSQHDSSTELIPTDLDGQITDLLSAIRKSEEDDVQKTGNDGGEKPDNINEQAEGNTDVINTEEGGNDDEIDEDAGNEIGDENNFDNDNAEFQNTELGDVANTENPQVPNGTAKQDTIDISDESNKDENSQEGDGDVEMADIASENSPTKTVGQSDDKVGDLKSGATGRSTPARMSARLANVTPSTIRTRRASRLAPQN